MNLTLSILYLAGCKSDTECPYDEACINRECQDPCPYAECGTNAICEARAHLATCYCPEGTKGDPYIRCDRYECLRDPDCPTTLACRNEKCVDPCACARNAECDPKNHRGFCTCIPGYTGDPYGVECIPILDPIIEEPDCITDGDCPSKLGCYGDTCKNPCLEDRPCASNAECTVKDTLPMRTMVCTCKEGYIGKGDIRCDKIVAPIQVGCSSDFECPNTQACENRKCFNPCVSRNPCAPIATCTVQNHRATCRCPEGMTGDPTRQCQPIQVGCSSDSECPYTEACINRQCRDPCRYPSNPCGTNAQCETMDHRAVCTCPITWAGNPHIECYQYECLINDDCPLSKACVNQECVDPCRTTACGTNALCEVDYHQSTCLCPPGLQGNPYISCISVECRRDDDCADNERCDLSQQECVPLCRGNRCAEGAVCRASNHRETCHCPPPLQGDGYAFCAEPSKNLNVHLRKRQNMLHEIYFSS